MASKYTITDEQIAASFAKIENELIASMVRNFERHKVDEVASGIQWSMWQAEQIKSLREYTANNTRRYGKQFDKLNERLETIIEDNYNSAKAAQYHEISKALQAGWDGEQFFQVPSERLDALIRSTHSDMMKAEYATLRKAEDIYRQTIFNAQVYAQSGAGTYQQAIDMATKDFIAKGIQSVEYRSKKDGRVVGVHSIREYSQMVVRTSTKRAAFVAEGDARNEWGVHTVIVDYRDEACPECMEWVGQVLIDDVYSGGSEQEAQETGYALLSEAMGAGLFHPNCQDTMSAWFPDVSKTPEKPSEAAQSRAEAREELEQVENQARAKEREYERLSEFSLDPENQAKYETKAQEWSARAKSVDTSYQTSVYNSAQSHGTVAEALDKLNAMSEKAWKLKEETPQEVFEQLEAIRNGGKELTVYRATRGDTINAGDWVFLSHEQADRFARMRFNPEQYKPGYKVLTEKLPASQVHWTGKNYEFMVAR